MSDRVVVMKDGEVQQIRLNPTVQQNVVTYNVRVSLQNPEQILLPGMTAYVNIAVARRDDALLVPNAALRFKPAESDSKPAGGEGATGNGKGRKRDRNDHASGTVHVIDGERIKPVGIEIGITDNRMTEVVGGELKPGDQVIVGENASAAGKPSSVGMRLF